MRGINNSSFDPMTRAGINQVDIEVNRTTQENMNRETWLWWTYTYLIWTDNVHVFSLNWSYTVNRGGQTSRTSTKYDPTGTNL